MFAAAVLMPARLVQEQYVRCERDFFRLCDKFGAVRRGDGPPAPRRDKADRVDGTGGRSVKLVVRLGFSWRLRRG